MKTTFRRFMERHTNNVSPIRTADIMTFAHSTRPPLMNSYFAVGKIFEVDMKSGKTALFKCVNYEGTETDWGWYDLIFWGYK